MRYYKLTLSNAAGQIYDPATFRYSSTATSTFSSQIQAPGRNGSVNNPGALDIEFDVPISASHEPMGQARICVHGVGIQMLSQGTQLAGNNVSLLAGMAPGLPLATAQAGQAGLILQGQVFSSYGNWQGTDQTLELLCIGGTILEPGSALPKNLGGIQWVWMPGQSLATAISNALTQAFPGCRVIGSGELNPTISSQLQLPDNYPQKGVFGGLAEFAKFIKQMTQDLGATFTNEDSAAYYGVNIILQGNAFVVTDGTFKKTPIKLNGFDLIGQPTWLKYGVISFKTVLRGDISIGDSILFPAGAIGPYVGIEGEALLAPNAPYRAKSIFQNAFKIAAVQHFAHFRQTDGSSWATQFTALAPLTQAQRGEPSFFSLVNGSG